MVSSISFNMGYNGSYMIMPFAKTKNENGIDLSVNSNFHEEEINNDSNYKIASMDNLNDLKRADTDNNGMISLEELKACDNKSLLMERIIFDIEQYETNWKTINGDSLAKFRAYQEVRKYTDF